MRGVLGSTIYKITIIFKSGRKRKKTFKSYDDAVNEYNEQHNRENCEQYNISNVTFERIDTELLYSTLPF